LAPLRFPVIFLSSAFFTWPLTGAAQTVSVDAGAEPGRGIAFRPLYALGLNRRRVAEQRRKPTSLLPAKKKKDQIKQVCCPQCLGVISYREDRFILQPLALNPNGNLELDPAGKEIFSPATRTPTRKLIRPLLWFYHLLSLAAFTRNGGS